MAKKFVLPKKWYCLFKNEEEFKVAKKFFNKSWSYYPGGCCNNERSNHWWSLTDESENREYERITFQQFQKYVVEASDALPKKWCIRLKTREINDAVNSIGLWQHGALHWENSKNYTSCYIGHDGAYGENLLGRGYKPITFDQFKKHVLPKPKPVVDDSLPERWYIEVTKENKSTLEKWRTCGGLGSSYGYLMYPGFQGVNGYWMENEPQSIPKISFAQFKKYVLKEEAPKEKKGEVLPVPEKWILDIKSLTEGQQARVGAYFYEQSGNECYTRLDRFSDIASHNLSGKSIVKGRENGEFSLGASFADWKGHPKGKEFTPITYAQFEKYILKGGEKYEVSDLLKKGIVVFLANRDEHARLEQELKLVSKPSGGGLCDWAGPHCYDLSIGMYSSSSTRTNPGAYEGSTIVSFDQINFKGVTSKVTGYKLIKGYPNTKGLEVGKLIKLSDLTYDGLYDGIKPDEYPEFWEPIKTPVLSLKKGDWVTVIDPKTAIDGSRGFGWIDDTKERTFQVVSDKPEEYHTGTYYEVKSPGGSKGGLYATFRMATPEEIEKVTKVTIEGYSSKITDEGVSFGCKNFTKEEVRILGDILQRSGLKIEKYHDEVMKVVRLLK